MLIRSLVLLMLGLVSAAVSSAQNSDTGVLFSFRRSSYSFNNPPNEVKATSNGVSVSLVQAFQLRERGPHRLYIEIPLVTAGGVSESVQRREPNLLVETRGQISTLSAGPRYQYAISDRWSVYAVADFGVAWYDQSSVSSSPFRASKHTEANPAFGYGGGVDFRLSKLISLRGEIRQFVLFGAVPGSRFGLSPSLGVAVHF